MLKSLETDDLLKFREHLDQICIMIFYHLFKHQFQTCMEIRDQLMSELQLVLVEPKLLLHLL